MTSRELRQLSNLLGRLYEEHISEWSADQQYAIHRARDIALALLESREDD